MLLKKKESLLFKSLYEDNFENAKSRILDLESLNFLNSEGESPLSVACYECGDLNIKELIFLMLSKKADINHYESPGFTPLFNAVLSLRPYVVEILLKNGANPNINFFSDEFPEIISSALDLTYTRYLESAIKLMENPDKKDDGLTFEADACKLIIHMLANAGAEISTDLMFPELS